MSVLWTPLRLVVEDTERATKAASDQLALSKEAFHRQLNSALHQRSVPQSNAAVNKFTVSSSPYDGSSEQFKNFCSCSGDANYVVPPPPPINQLESFQERSYPIRGFTSNRVTGKGSHSSNELSEKDDEGERQRSDDLPSFSSDVKDGPPLFVRLPKETDMSDPEKSMNRTSSARVDVADRPEKNPGGDKMTNNNKEYDDQVETTCALDCLYFTLQCCDCSIM